MTRHRRYRILLTGVAVGTALALGVAVAAARGGATGANLPVLHADYPVYGSVAALGAAADAVVVGRVGGVAGRELDGGGVRRPATRAASRWCSGT